MTLAQAVLLFAIPLGIILAVFCADLATLFGQLERDRNNGYSLNALGNNPH